MKIKRMRLINFMCYADKVVDFFDKTCICGRNAVGKSSIYSAYMWLMYGCDCDLKDNPDVRHRVNGEAVKDADVEVEAILDIDDKDVIVRKVQKRTYGKDGVSYKDDNSYYINEVSKTLKAFNEYLCVDGYGKMYSNINAFLNQKPNEMREYLFTLANSVSDVEIARQAGYTSLVNLLEKYTLDEIVSLNKKSVADAKKEQPLLDGAVKEKERDISIKADKGVAELELKIASLNEQIVENIKKQTDISAIYEEKGKMAGRTIELQFQLSDMQNKANADLVSERNDLDKQKYDLMREVINIEKEIKQNDRDMTVLNDKLTHGKKEREKLAEKWEVVNNEKFNEATTICPTCHRELPPDEIDKLRIAFSESKKNRLEGIETMGNAVADSMREANADMQRLKNVNENLKRTVDEKNNQIAAISTKLSELPTSIDISDTDEYKNVMRQIEESITDAGTEDIGELLEKLKSEESYLRNELADCKAEISACDTTADKERLDELRSKQRANGQVMANAQAILDIVDEFNKVKNDNVNDEINGNFTLVKWQLWTRAKNGEYKNCCIPLVNGYNILTTAANKGKRIMGRLDIARSIQAAKGIQMPIFLDDCENLDVINQDIAAGMTDVQLIMLKVTDDKELKIKEG